jgi:predicted metal-dependent hydrolase
MKILETNGVSYTLYKASRTSVSITVKRDGSVHVRAPYWMTRYQVEHFVQQKTAWIRVRQQAVQQEPALPPAGRELEQLKKQAAEKFRELALPWEHRFKERYGVAPQRWTVRLMDTRWGSCSLKTGRITLNLRLLYKLDDCIEYIIVHELCHLLVPGHDKRFYTLLEQELPDWKSRKKRLNG